MRQYEILQNMGAVTSLNNQHKHRVIVERCPMRYYLCRWMPADMQVNMKYESLVHVTWMYMPFSNFGSMFCWVCWFPVFYVM